MRKSVLSRGVTWNLLKLRVTFILLFKESKWAFSVNHVIEIYYANDGFLFDILCTDSSLIFHGNFKTEFHFFYIYLLVKICV